MLIVGILAAICLPVAISLLEAPGQSADPIVRLAENDVAKETPDVHFDSAKAEKVFDSNGTLMYNVTGSCSWATLSGERIHGTFFRQIQVNSDGNVWVKR